MTGRSGLSAETTRVLRFAVVGVTVSALYAGLYALFRWAEMTPGIASPLAFGLAVIWQYIAQSLWTFSAGIASGSQAARFVATVSMGAITAALVSGLIAPAIGAPEAVAILAVMGLTAAQNYLFFRLWVYRRAIANDG
ncbi:MAG: GtrA family protein [Pseudomonadota bacterium]